MDLSKLSDSDLQQIAKGDLRMVSEEGLKMLAGEAKTVKPDIKRQAAEMTMEGMSPADKFFAGMGKRMSDIFTLGMREEPSSDKTLMDSGWAQAGGVGADLATLIGGGTALRGGAMLANAPKMASAVKTAFMPNSLIPAVVSGGVYNAATTNGDISERGKAGIAGAVGGAVVPAAATLWRGGKALVEPLTRKGQEAIAGRTIRRFAGDKADDVARIMSAPEVFVKGSIPTAAEASGNSGIAALQQGLSNVDKGGFGNALSAQQQANRAARVNALQGIGGDDVAMQNAIDARELASDAFYKRAKAATIEGDSSLDAILQRPLVQDGMRFAKEIAANEGRGVELSSAKLADRLMNTPAKGKTYSGQALHDLKLGIDKAFTIDASTGAARRAGASEVSAKKEFLSWIENKLPDYGMARKEFERLSKPVNQMMIGNELLNKLRPALADYGANTRETAATFARALRDADATAAKATGFSKTTMQDVMTPEQMDIINGVAKDLARKANSDDLIRGVGSNTAQNLAVQNALRQTLGPLGLPQSWAESAMLQTVFKPLNLIYSGVGEQRIADSLGKAMLDPREAARLMALRKAQQSSMGGLLNYAPAVGISVLPQLSQ